MKALTFPTSHKGLVAAARRARGPRRHGPSAREVAALALALYDSDPATHAAARAALEELGPFAIPVALNALEDGPPHARVAACDLLGRARAPTVVVDALARALDDAAPPVQAAAARALGMIGPAARDAATAPLLRVVRGCHDDQARLAGVVALLGVEARGPRAARAVARALTDERREVRLNAALLLRSMRVDDVEAALPALTRLLGHRSDDVCDDLVTTLVQLGRRRPDAVAGAIATALRPARPRAHATAALVLSQLGRRDLTWSREAFVWLVHRDGWIRTCAVVVIGRLDLTPKQRARRVVAALAEAKPHTLQHLLTLWPSLGLETAARSAVIDLARDRRAEVRCAAVTCSARLRAEDAAPLLLELARDDDGAVSAAALEALGRPDLPRVPLLDVLVAALRRPSTCDLAARALCRRIAASSEDARETTAPVASKRSAPVSRGCARRRRAVSTHCARTRVAGEHGLPDGSGHELSRGARVARRPHRRVLVSTAGEEPTSALLSGADDGVTRHPARRSSARVRRAGAAPRAGPLAELRGGRPLSLAMFFTGRG